MDALAKEGPLDTRQLALRVIKAKGLFENEREIELQGALEWRCQYGDRRRTS
jgi:hypothetical protein